MGGMKVLFLIAFHNNSVGHVNCIFSFSFSFGFGFVADIEQVQSVATYLFLLGRGGLGLRKCLRH